MEGSSNSLGSDCALESSGAKPGMQHGASSKAKSLTSKPARSGAVVVAEKASLGDAADAVGIHQPPPPPSQLTTSDADAEAPQAVVGCRGTVGSTTVASSVAPATSNMPAAARGGMYPSSRRQGGAAKSLGTRPALHRAGVISSAATQVANGRDDDVSGESSASNTGYYHNRYYDSDQVKHFNCSMYGSYNNQREYPGGGGSSGSTSVPYGSTPGPMAGSSSSGTGAGDGQSVPVHSFPYSASPSTAANPQQYHSHHSAQYQLSQRQQSQYSLQQQQQPYSPQISATDQGSSAYQSYFQQPYQSQQPQMQQQPQLRPQQFQSSSSSQSTRREGQCYGYCYGSGAGQRRTHACTASSCGGTYYPNLPPPPQQHGYPPTSSGEGETLYNQVDSAHSGSAPLGTAEGYYRLHAQYSACMYPGPSPSAPPPTLQQPQRQLQQQHPSYAGEEGLNTPISASYGYALQVANRSSQPCSIINSAYGCESDTTQGTSAERFASEAYGQLGSAASNMNGSEGSSGGVRGYSAGTGAAVVTNGASGVGSGGAATGYYGTGYTSGYGAPVPHAPCAQSATYMDAGSDTTVTPLGPAGGRSGQAAARGSYPSPQQGIGAEVEGGGHSYRGYTTNGYRDCYYAASNQVGGGAGPGCGYSNGQASPQQPSMSYQASYGCGEAQPASSAAASLPFTGSHQRGSGGPPQRQQQYQRGGSFYATDPRGGVDGSGGSYDAHGYASQHMQQQHKLGCYRGPSQHQHRPDARTGGGSMPASRHDQYVPPQPETAPRRLDTADEQCATDVAEELARTQTPDDMVRMTRAKGVDHSRSSSSGGGNGRSEGGVGGRTAPSPPRKKGRKGGSSGAACAPSTANNEAARGTAESDGRQEACGKRSAARNTAAVPVSTKKPKVQRQASLQRKDTRMPGETLLGRESLVSVDLPPSSVNTPRRQKLAPQHAGEGSTTGRSGGMLRREDCSQQAAHRCTPANGGAAASADDVSECLLAEAGNNRDEEAEAEFNAAIFKDNRRGTVAPAMPAVQSERHGAGSAGDRSRGPLQQGSCSTERSAAQGSPVPHSSCSASGAQSFLRRSPLTQCLGAPFHTYICGAIVEQAAQLQANACSSSATDGETGVAAVRAGTPLASLSAASSQVLPAMYAPVQRLLSRDVARATCISVEEKNREPARPSIDSGDRDAEDARADSGENEGYAYGEEEAMKIVGEGSKDEDTEVDLERLRDSGRAQLATSTLTADALASSREASVTAPPSSRSGTILTDNSLRSIGGRPHHMHLFTHHHSHHMRRSTPASDLSSPLGPILHHCHAYHGTSPFLQPASLAVSGAASLAAGGSAAASKRVQSPESGSSAALPPRLPSGGGGSTPHLHGVGGGLRDGSGAAATTQPQQTSMAPYSQHYRHPFPSDLDGGRCAAAMEEVSGDTEEPLHYSYQGNSSGAGNSTNLSLRQQQQQSTGAGGGTSDRRAGPGGASLTSSLATLAYSSTFLNASSQNSLPLSLGATARPESATLSPTTQQQPRAASTGGAGFLGVSPEGGSPPGSRGGPANNNNSCCCGGGHPGSSAAHHRYATPTHSSGYRAGGSQMSALMGGRYAISATRPPFIYEHHVGQELLLEELQDSMRFSPASFGNIACLVDAFSPHVPVASDLEFPCNEDQCQLICTQGSRDAFSLPGGSSSQHGSAQCSRSSRGGAIPASLSEDARTVGGAGHSSTSGGGGGQEGSALPIPRPAYADRTHYWDFTGPSYCEPIMTLKSIWQSFDNPFGCVVRLAEPIYPAPMRPAERELVYTPLLSGFRIRFHPASPAYKRLASLREVRRQRRREEAATRESAGVSAEVERVAAGSCHSAGSYAEEDGVLTWSATDRPNNRNIIVEQMVELAKCDESYAELLTATTADIDHQSWVALMWQPVFCGGHSSKHSCGTFLAYYLLRAPRHLFIPFADKSEGAAMNSSWNSPVFRGDRAALSFDLWSLQRHYHVARWVSPPPMTHIMTALSVGGEDDVPDNASSSCASTSRGRNSWEEGQTGCASNRTTESCALSANGDSRLRLRDFYAGSSGACGAAGGGSSNNTVGGAVKAPHITTGTANSATSPATATTAIYARIPLVGLIPNRCRSEVWYKPVYDTSLMSMHSRNGGSGGVMGGDGTGPGVVGGGGVGMGTSNGLGGGGGGGSGVGGNVGGGGDHSGLYTFYAPLFLIVTALQLMCWDAYVEWERKPPTSAAVAARSSAFSEERRDPEDLEVAIGGAAGASGTTPSSSFIASMMVEEAMLSAQRQQQQSDHESDAAAAAAGGGNAGKIAGSYRSSPWSSYVAKGVELMTDAARQYRTVREVANLDAAAEESAGGGAVAANSSVGFAATGSEAGVGSAEERRSVDEDKSVAKQHRGGSAVVAGGTSSALCDPAARVIAGLLDYYQWAQYDTSLTALAAAYCAT
ncbi:hypothetical protein GH5_05206 [Leishmania sp. Ghana 2012 LV757]|uniref:hypothetical protein n=1 Tax=Leishmania sp. Ghana 2012 LV757 TaxID=2803181 RepID=UPI001B430C41|nr:hypothetical protein GH5_05206 [Leishmania sp. Ghana 2012 LV757]